MKDKVKYAGADWISEVTRKPISDLGRDVADILGQVYQGIYHLDKQALKVDWSNEDWIEIVIWGCLCTWDFSHLTNLVIMCHETAIRLELIAAAPNYLRLVFYRRKRQAEATSKRHPTIEEAVERVRKHNILPEAK